MKQLYSEALTATRAPPEAWLYVLHGVFGAGRNWATLARRLVRARPDWGALLVDLREHGRSKGFSGPHTIAAAAGDLHGLTATYPPAAVLGHSFGGKVALAWAGTRPSGLRQAWSVDSAPGAGPPGGSAWRMLEVLESLPGPFGSREEGVTRLIEAGTAPDVARWMTTNLVARDGVYVWRLDLSAIRSLLEDFFRVDLWPMLETATGIETHVIRALESSVISTVAATRLRNAPDRVRLHEVEGGHWLNVDNPDALLELLSSRLPDLYAGQAASHA